MSENKVTLVLLLTDGGIEDEERDKDIFPQNLWDYLWAGDEVYQFVAEDPKTLKLLEATEGVETQYRLRYAAWVHYDKDHLVGFGEVDYPYIDGKLLSVEVEE